jgi:hypothetical protein
MLNLCAMFCMAVMGGLGLAEVIEKEMPAKNPAPAVQSAAIGTVGRIVYRSTYDPAEIDAAPEADKARMQGCKNWELELEPFPPASPRDVTRLSFGRGPKAIAQRGKLTKALKEGHPVTVAFKQVAQHDPCRSKTDYIITGFTALDSSPVRPVIQAAPAR